MNLFEKLAQGRPPTTEATINQPRRDHPPIEVLLDWLVNHWAKVTVTGRDIYTFGPHSLRDKNTTLNLAQSLVERGWLVPIDTHQGKGHHRFFPTAADTTGESGKSFGQLLNRSRE